MATLLAENLRFRYPSGGFGLEFDRLELRAGEPLAVLGASGGGKTTLLRLLSGLLLPETGSVRLNGGEPLGSLSVEARRHLRLKRMGLVFQDFALLDYLTVAENLLLPSRFLSLESGPTEERARRLADQLEIGSHWLQPTSRLSQGERQRVAIARALVHAPDFIFADEPTAALDTARSSRVVNLLLEASRSTGACLVIVTHDPRVAEACPRRLHMEELRA
jgi:putative ABC transport system ATP-binding protein